MWHMCTLHEQPQRTDQNFMQDKLVERSVLGLYEHGTVASTTPTFSWYAPTLKTQIYTLTHMDHLPHQHCCARGRRPHTVDLPPHQRGRRTGGARPEEEGQIKGDINVLGVTSYSHIVHYQFTVSHNTRSYINSLSN